MSSAIPYEWRAKYGEISTLLMARLKELKEENHRLKAEISLEGKG